jgi:hypothetical protein
MEHVPAAEVARRVKANPPNKDRGYDRGVNDLVKAAGKVWRCLKAGKFEETAEGYIKIDPIDTSDYDYSGCIIGEVETWFVDNSGYAVRLGAIDFTTAEANISPNETEPLYPSDDRWDAIVGSIGRAILQCQKEVNRRIPDARA